MSSALASFVFNELPDDVRHKIFKLCSETERALISSTCKRWYDLINRTKAYWKDVDIPEDATKERADKMLQAFSARSDNSLVKVKVGRRLQSRDELVELFQRIKPSANTLKFLDLCHGGGFSFSDLHFWSKSFSEYGLNLDSLSCSSTPEAMKADFQESVEQTLAGRGYYRLVLVRTPQDEGISRPFQLRRIHADHIDLDQASSILGSSNLLESFQVKALIPAPTEDQDPPTSGPLAATALKRLALPTYPLNRPAWVFTLVAPMLTSLACRLSQIDGVKTTQNLKTLVIILDYEGDQRWGIESVQNYSRDFQRCLTAKPSVVELYVRGALDAPRLFQASRVEVMIQCLRWSGNRDQAALCPEIKQLNLPHGQMSDTAALERMIESRNNFSRATGRKRVQCYVGRLLLVVGFKAGG